VSAAELRAKGPKSGTGHESVVSSGGVKVFGASEKSCDNCGKWFASVPNAGGYIGKCPSES